MGVLLVFPVLFLSLAALDSGDQFPKAFQVTSGVMAVCVYLIALVLILRDPEEGH